MFANSAEVVLGTLLSKTDHKNSLIAFSSFLLSIFLILSLLAEQIGLCQSLPQGYKTFFMLNSAEHEI